MPLIKVWCLPPTEERTLNALHQCIVRNVCWIPELDLHSENDMTVLFPCDLMKYGLGEEVIVEISGLFERPERTRAVLSRLARNVGEAVSLYFPSAKIECFVYPFTLERNVFWSNKK